MPAIKGVKARADGSPNGASATKGKPTSSNRTVQACDRCKTRKMRCDDLPEGCAPCVQNQTECTTTDRTTNRRTVRGYVQTLERHIRELEDYTQELQNQIVSMGGEVKPFVPTRNLAMTPLPECNALLDHFKQADQENHNHSTKVTENSTLWTDSSGHESSNGGGQDNFALCLRDFRGGLAGNNYLGVSSGNSLLSSIRGTSMNVMGMEINLADYMSTDLDEPDQATFLTSPVYNKSYSAFVHSAFSEGPKMQRIELPPRQNGLTYAEWYFRVINPYLPILHKPTFISLLTRVYDNQDNPHFSLLPAETVLVHMLFAIMFFQYGSRNGINSGSRTDLNERSNCHYHYALSFFHRLVASHTLQDVQALTMICVHLRSFPKPGACWLMTATTFNLAIDLGLHRSAKQWAPTTPKKSILEIEIRKRIFWSILTIHIVISGKLGRPMALRVDDFDVELPDTVDDDLLSDAGLDSSREGKCSFLVGIEGFKCQLIFMDLYNNIYAVRRSPKTYVETIRRLDTRINQWHNQIPSQLIPESVVNDEEARVQALYMSISFLEFRLLLHHPSLSLTSSAEFNAENLTVCMDASQKMLHHVKRIQMYKSLDTNWQTGALYVLAVSTTLFGYWERRNDTTLANLVKLKDDMSSWLDIMGDVGELLGSGKGLQEAVCVIVDNALGRLFNYICPKPISAPLPNPNHPVSGSLPVQRPATHHASVSPQNVYTGSDAWVSEDAISKSLVTSGETLRQNSAPIVPFASMDETLPSTRMAPNPYPNPLGAPNYAYSEPSAPPLPPYRHPPQTLFQHPSFLHSSTFPSNPQPAVGAATPYIDFSNPAASSYGLTVGTSAGLTGYASPSSWRHWAGNMAPNLEPQDHLSQTNMLMHGAGSDASGGLAGTNGLMMPIATTAVMNDNEVRREGPRNGIEPVWPLNIFDSGPGMNG